MIEIDNVSYNAVQNDKTPKFINTKIDVQNCLENKI